MSRATLPAEARMHRPSEFAAALKGKRLARGALFVVSAAPVSPSADQAACARLGLVIAKRYAALATTRNAIKKFRSETNKEEAVKMYPEVVSMIDKLAKQNVIHKNKASNLKSKLALQINRL